jgi:hypothetical protein
MPGGMAAVVCRHADCQRFSRFAAGRVLRNGLAGRATMTYPIAATAWPPFDRLTIYDKRPWHRPYWSGAASLPTAPGDPMHSMPSFIEPI